MKKTTLQFLVVAILAILTLVLNPSVFAEDFTGADLVVPDEPVMTNTPPQFPLVEEGYVAEPSVGEVPMVQIFWPKTGVTVLATLRRTNVTEMRVWVDGGNREHEWKSGSPTNAWDAWIVFAIKVATQFERIGDGLYVDRVPFECLGVSTTLEHFERPKDLSAVVLSRGKTVTSIPEDRWRGAMPKEGEVVHLGRSDSFKGVFFRVVKVDEKFYVDPELIGELATSEGRRSSD